MRISSPVLKLAVQVTFLAAPMLVGACGDVPTAPPFPDEGVPASFTVSVWAWPTGTNDVTLRGDTLVVLRFSDVPQLRRTARVVPDRTAWAAFWRAAEAAGVRSWPRECTANDILDGSAFTVAIEYPGGKVEASGGNSFPRRDGRCMKGSATDEYRAFMAAVGTLIGESYPYGP